MKDNRKCFEKFIISTIGKTFQIQESEVLLLIKNADESSDINVFEFIVWLIDKHPNLNNEVNKVLQKLVKKGNIL